MKNSIHYQSPFTGEKWTQEQFNKYKEWEKKRQEQSNQDDCKDCTGCYKCESLTDED